MRSEVDWSAVTRKKIKRGERGRGRGRGGRVLWPWWEVARRVVVFRFGLEQFGLASETNFFKFCVMENLGKLCG